MPIKGLKNNFKTYCSNNKLEINNNQVVVIDALVKFYKDSTKKNLLNLFKKETKILGFYLFGDVGVGKTMLLDYFYKNIKLPKKRMHFNEFMINFHDFAHTQKKKDKKNSIESFVKKTKKECELIFFDEFQVTNIVDAMILGNLFKKMFDENIKFLITSNIKINNLYKEGLQREQFIPFIDIMKKFCTEMELVIGGDYRKSKSNKLDRFFFPLNEQTNFKINQIYRKLTKNKKNNIKRLEIKGRIFEIKKYYEKIARFKFNELCDKNIGSEDYIKIAENCNFIVIEDIPFFNDNNVNKQQRFITLIDILYEKKIPLMTSSSKDLENFGSSSSLKDPFKRTLSRLHELTSTNVD